MGTRPAIGAEPMGAPSAQRVHTAWPGRHWPASARRWLICGLSLTYFCIVAAASWARCRLGRARARLVVLYYHAVPDWYRPVFAAQLDLVLAGADRVVHADFEGPEYVGELLVGITFDDAFSSVADNALPELLRRGMPATVFAPAGVLGRLPDWSMDLEAEGRCETVMSADRLKAIANDTIRIGSHSISHCSLAMADDQTAETEIAGSKQRLVAVLDADVSLFSFPYGEEGGRDDRLERLCRRAAYRFAFTSQPQTLDPAEGRFLRGRILVRPDDSLLEFWLKMRGGYSWLPRAWAIRDRLLRA